MLSLNKKEIKEFFDNCAPWWDDDMVRNESVIKKILDNGGVKIGVDVLDVACGTGVLFPDYLKREVNSLTAIDFSPKMVEIARKKFPQVNVICQDVETADFNQRFDVVMVYNAFPHFPNPKNLIKALAKLTKPEGRLSIAHGMSRENLIRHHLRAENVSLILPTVDELASLLAPYFTVDTIISNDQMYQVVGIKKTIGDNRCKSYRV